MKNGLGVAEMLLSLELKLLLLPFQGTGNSKSTN